jgi:hypothetical protein
MRFENSLSEGLRNVILAAFQGRPVFTRKNASKLRKDSNRIEISFVPGEATRHAFTIDKVQSLCRWDAWRGQFLVQIITKARSEKEQEAGVDVHDDWRAEIRNIMEDLPGLLTSDLCPYHLVSESIASGTTPTLKSEDGWEACTLAYGVYFSIRSDAWPVTP